LPKGILLYWPPWTWKTTITLILAKHSWAWVFVADANQEDSLVWESANNIKKIIDEAKEFIDEKNKPAIIFFDEADTLFSKRWWNVKDFKEWMLSVLLQEMDWFGKKYEWKLTFVFWTNRKDILDSAVLSRVDKQLEIPLPNKEARKKILDLHIKKKMKWLRDTVKMYETANLELDYLAKELKWKSWRFIKNLVKNFHTKALSRFKKDKNFVITNEFILESVRFTEDKWENVDKIMWFKV
jgi:SpoVK/Ycf46/Vps4 family AAA+-type ATPase